MLWNHILQELKDVELNISKEKWLAPFLVALVNFAFFVMIDLKALLVIVKQKHFFYLKIWFILSKKISGKLGQLGLRNWIRPSDLESDDGIGCQLNNNLDSDDKIGFWFN